MKVFQMSNLEIFHRTAMKPGHCAMRLKLRQLFIFS